MTALTHPAGRAFEDERLSDEDFQRLGLLAFRLAGLTIPENKRSMVQSRLARRLRTLGRTGISDYLDYVESSEAESERRAFISVMTTNVSSFLREKHHFDTLEEKILPALVEIAKRGKRVRFWSAGCSSGQEPYTLAISLLRRDPKIASLDVQILATDIDTQILNQARDGQYAPREIDGFSETDRRKYFTPTSDNERVEVGADVKSLVTFKHLNLHAAWPMKGKFDVIMCRNVLIYFDTATQESLWPRFRDQLSPSGWLFLGHSERIADPAKFGFKAEGVTTYRPARQ